MPLAMFPTRFQHFDLAQDRPAGGAITHPRILPQVRGVDLEDALALAHRVHGGVWRAATDADRAAAARFWARD